MNEKKEINALHYKYIIFILCIIIISLIVVRYTADTSLNNYVSFAATIASLILAVLAIIQGFFSSSAFTDSISNLKNTTNDIAEKSEQLNNIMNEFDNKFKDIPSQLEGLNKSYFQLSETSKLASTSDTGVAISSMISEQNIENIFSNSSWLGRLSLLCITLSQEKNLPLDLKKVFIELGSIDDYIEGYLNALSALELFNYESKDEDLIYFSNVSPYFNDKIKIWIDNYLEQSDSLKETVVKVVNDINNYYK